MQETGLRNPSFGADKFGFRDLAAVHWNLTDAPLYEHAIRNGEATVVRERRALRRDRRAHRPLARRTSTRWSTRRPSTRSGGTATAR